MGQIGRELHHGAYGKVKDAPPFNPKQEEQPDHEDEDDPCNHKTPIWIPSVRALVDTVTGLQFLFFAYPDGRLHPAQDVTHQQCFYYGYADTPSLPH